jgi:glycerol-3-phosphate dehydrogenase
VKKIVVVGTGRMGGAFATAFAERTSHTRSADRHAGSSSADALSHQLGVRVDDDPPMLSSSRRRRRHLTAKNLPVQAPVKYQTTVNLKTAKLLGLEVPRIAACSRR